MTVPEARAIGRMPLVALALGGTAAAVGLATGRFDSWDAAFAGICAFVTLAVHRAWRRRLAAAEAETRRQSEHAERLRRSEERFRTLVEGTTDWVWETDENHFFRWFSASFEKVMGVPAESVFGRRRWEVASQPHPLHAPLWRAHVADLDARRSFRDFRYWSRSGDGASRWISISGSPRYDDDGRFLGYRGSGSDITAEADSALRLKMLSTVVEQSPLSVLITDPTGAIEYVNAHFSTVTGYQPDEVKGRKAGMLGSGDTAPEVYHALWRTIASGKRWSGELKNRCKDGRFHWEMVAISPVVDHEGRIVHYVAVKEDVTERRALEEQLRINNAELEAFAYVASHDLRQPLRMVGNYLGLIERALGHDLPDDIRTFFGFAMGGVRRMDRLILDLLEYSCTGKTPEPCPVALDEAVADAVLNLDVAIREADAVVTVADALPVILGDRGELTRLFQNLIGNALKYCPAERRPTVEVGRREDPGAWVVWVADNGVGIAAEDRERAFSVFQRLGPRDACEGSGIGLAVCRRIVENHGGTVWIESEVGQGSRFLVSFPKRGAPEDGG